MMTAKLRGQSNRGESVAPTVGRLAPERYQRRTWVTRPRPGIDRMASAWLIQRFIDTQARFVFAETQDVARLPTRQVPFDMFGAEFGHHGSHCSFETLCHRFGIDEPAVRRIAEIVHDVDLKDDTYARTEAATIAQVIQGLQATSDDDHQLLRHGMALFAGLYASLVQTAGAVPPRRRR